MAGEFQAGSIVSKMILDKTQWSKSVDAAKREAKGLSGFIEKNAEKFKKVGKSASIAGGVILGSLGMIVKKASDAQETTAKFGTIFESVFERANTSAKNLAKNYGLSSLAAKEMLGATGDLLTGLGMSSGVALTLSERTQQLSVDLASFTNYSGGAKGASEALTKAMLGERESVKALGIVITEEMVKEQLLKEGKEKLTGQALLQAKAEATLTIAMSQSKNAIGDYARTQGSLANVTRSLKASVTDLVVKLGEHLIPIATKIAQTVKKVVERITEWVDKHPTLTSWIMKGALALGGLLTVVGPFLIMLPKVAAGLKLVVAGFKLMKIASMASLGPIGLVTAGLAALAVGFMKVKSAQDAARKASENYEKNIVKLKTKLNDARKEAGLSATEWNKLVKAYEGNYAAMAMAIRKGKEGKEMQEALTKVSKKSKEAYDKQKKATLELGKSFETTYVKQKTWVDYVKSIGLKTIKEKQDRVKELGEYIKQLAEAHKKGEISLKAYTKAVKLAKEEIRGYSETLVATAIPKTRDMTGVLQAATPWMYNMADSTDEAKMKLRWFADQMGMTAAEVQIKAYNMMQTFASLSGVSLPRLTLAATETTQTVTSEWSSMADGIRTSWVQNISEVLKGSKSLSEGLKGIFGSVKNQFFDMVSQMIAKWAFGFVAKILSGGKGLLSSVTGIFKGIGGFFSKLFGAGGEAQTAVTGSGGLVSNFLGGISKMAGPIGLGLLAAKLIGFKNIQKTVQDVWKAVSENVVNSIKAIGKVSDAVLGAVADVVTGIGKGISSAISGIGKLVGGIGGLFGGKDGKNTVRILRDISWWIQALTDRVIGKSVIAILDDIKTTGWNTFEKWNAMLEKADHVNEKLAKIWGCEEGIYERLGVAESILGQAFSAVDNRLASIDNGVQGILNALSSKGTVYVDVFRSGVFENVGAGIARSVDSMGGFVGGAIKGIHFPDFDVGGIADEFAKRIPSARTGSAFVSPGGTLATPELAGTARQLSTATVGGPAVVHQNIKNEVRIDGTVITDRDYTRERLIPEIIDAMDANVKKAELKAKLGI